MHQRQRLFLTAAFSIFLIGLGARVGVGQELVANGGFESGVTDWTLFVPDESSGKNCRFDVVTTSPHSGKSCVRMQSDDFARFGVGGASFPVQPGEHYRVTAWVKADATTQVRPKTPGFVIRLNLHQNSADAAGGHFYIEPGNVVTHGDAPADSTTPLPTEWTKVETVVEIPTGVDSLGPSFFAWWTSGTFFVDDFSIQKVDAATSAKPADAAQ